MIDILSVLMAGTIYNGSGLFLSKKAICNPKDFIIFVDAKQNVDMRFDI